MRLHCSLLNVTELSIHFSGSWSTASSVSVPSEVKGNDKYRVFSLPISVTYSDSDVLEFVWVTLYRRTIHPTYKTCLLQCMATVKALAESKCGYIRRKVENQIIENNLTERTTRR